MRKLLATAGMFGALALSVGCKHTGGQCDCAAVPGDSVGHNPHVSHHYGTGIVSTPIVHGTSTGGSFEPINPPKTQPAR